MRFSSEAVLGSDDVLASIISHVPDKRVVVEICQAVRNVIYARSWGRLLHVHYPAEGYLELIFHHAGKRIPPDVRGLLIEDPYDQQQFNETIPEFGNLLTLESLFIDGGFVDRVRVRPLVLPIAPPWGHTASVGEFGYYASLEVLNVRWDDIVDLSAVRECPRLKHLNISSRDIYHMVELSTCTQLTHVRLHAWGLHSMKTTGRLDVSGCAQLQELQLRGSMLPDISSLALCSQLKKLSLNGSVQSGLQTALDGCTQLEVLVLLTDTSVEDLSALRFSSNSMLKRYTHTPARYFQLNISTLAECSRLQQLNLSCSRVADISALAGCTYLTDLDLSCCTNVQNISALTECVHLQKVNLHATQITSISALAGCAQLKFLDLRQTKIEDVSPLAECTKLCLLDLRHTQTRNWHPFPRAVRALKLRPTVHRDQFSSVHNWWDWV